MRLVLDEEGFVVRLSKYGATTLGHVGDECRSAPRWRSRWESMRDEWIDSCQRRDEFTLRLADYHANLFRSATLR